MINIVPKDMIRLDSLKSITQQ
jgi:translation initiation factor eIF-2B subunit beta